MKRFLFSVYALLFAATVHAGAGVKTRVPSADKLASNKLFTEDLVLHRLDAGHYTEAWFFQIHADDGGIMMLNLSITNAGVTRWASSVDVWYFIDGKTAVAHREYTPDRLGFDKKRLKLTINKTEFAGYPPKFWLKIDEPDARGMVTIDLSQSGAAATRNETFFDPKGDMYLQFALLALGARTKGEMYIAGRKVSLDGYIYANHQNGTVLPPDYCENWYSFVGLEKDFSFYLVSKKLEEGLSPSSWNMLMLVENGKLIGYTPDVKMVNLKNARNAESGYSFSTAYDFEAVGPDFTARGKLSLKEVYSWVDILAHLSTVLRELIRVFIANPWSMRAGYYYEIEIDRAGEKKTYRGVANTDNSFFTD